MRKGPPIKSKSPPIEPFFKETNNFWSNPLDTISEDNNRNESRLRNTQRSMNFTGQIKSIFNTSSVLFQPAPALPVTSHRKIQNKSPKQTGSSKMGGNSLFKNLKTRPNLSLDFSRIHSKTSKNPDQISSTERFQTANDDLDAVLIP